VRPLCKFEAHVQCTEHVLLTILSIIDEGLKFLERKFFIQKGNENLEAAEQNGRTKKD
jgi:hypothetical protein